MLFRSAFVLSLRDGRLSVDNRNTLAIIADDNRLVGDVSLQFAPGTLSVAPATANPIFWQRNFGKPLEIRGTVCSLLSGGGAEMGNYYHWLLDSLPRLHLVREAGLWASIDYFLIYNREHRLHCDNHWGWVVADRVDGKDLCRCPAGRITYRLNKRWTG